MRTKIMSAMLVLFAAIVFSLSACGGGGGGNAVPQTNSAPVANAGSVQNVLRGTLVTLDGSGSTDADGDTLTYKWAFTSKPVGSGAVLSSSSEAKPTFTPDIVGAYVLNLIVTDGKVDSAVSTVTINVSLSNVAPVANAGTNLKVRTGKLLTLDGSASSDADGDTLSYAWSLTSKPVGSSAVLSVTTAIHPTFTPDVDGSYVINLIVNDGKVDSTQSVVTINSVTDLRLLFSIITSRSGPSNNGYVEPGYELNSKITNVSNETFKLTKYVLTNGGATVSSTTSASLLNNYQLAPGESAIVSFTVQLFSIQDLGFAANYYLTDPVTSIDFVVSAPIQ